VRKQRARRQQTHAGFSAGDRADNRKNRRSLSSFLSLAAVNQILKLRPVFGRVHDETAIVDFPA
jgi:hypothetical protein